MNTNLVIQCKNSLSIDKLIVCNHITGGYKAKSNIVVYYSKNILSTDKSNVNVNKDIFSYRSPISCNLTIFLN